MKIFSFFRNNALLNRQNAIDYTMKVLPDTALLIQKRPFFIPDFTEECKVRLCYAVRINRLGRSINEKFASRYYDASSITLGVHFVACDLLRSLIEQGCPSDKAVGFDNAVAVSENRFDDFLESSQVRLNIDNTSYQYFIDSNLCSVIDQQIADISTFYTLKQGDILLFPVSDEEPSVSIDNHLSLYIDDKNILSFNIK